MDENGRILPSQLSILGWAIGFSAMLVLFSFPYIGSPARNLVSGQTYAFHNHGEVYYIWPWLIFAHYAGIAIGVVLVVIDLTLARFELRPAHWSLTKVQPDDAKAATVSRVTGWFFLLAFVLLVAAAVALLLLRGDFGQAMFPLGAGLILSIAAWRARRSFGPIGFLSAHFLFGALGGAAAVLDAKAATLVAPILFVIGMVFALIAYRVRARG